MAFDYDLFVIGGGSGGVRAARLVASRFSMRVALAEEYRVGGTCVIRGCVPKKLMAYAAGHGKNLADALAFGWSSGVHTGQGQNPANTSLTTRDFHFNWGAFQHRLAAELNRLEGLYEQTLATAGVTLYKTRAIVQDAHSIRTDDGQTFTAKHILIATGGHPTIPDIKGHRHAITSNEVFSLRTLPRRVLIVGGGYIACEFASIFNALGVSVTQCYRGAQILRGFDDETAGHVQNLACHQGIAVKLNTHVTALEKTNTGTVRACLQHTDTNTTELYDAVVFATGRSPNTQGLGLERIGVRTNTNGAICVDAYSQTNVPSIYAVGDVTGRIALTPVAIREAAAFVDTVFGGQPRAFDHRGVASAVFTNPEMASVGMTEQDARKEHSIKVYKTTFAAMDKRFAGRGEAVFMKLIVAADTGRILGCHIVSAAASEMSQLVAIAMHMGATKADFDATCAVHPTLAEELVTLT